jgi:hypothetical protein
MDEEMMNKIMSIACITLACIAGVGIVINMIVLANAFSLGALLSVPILAVVGGAGTYGAITFGRRIDGYTEVFSNAGEKEVLSWKQRQELRKARGSVVMERALVEIEHEHQNIVHRQITAANDEDKPPHKTQWTTNPEGHVDKREIGGHVPRRIDL